MVHSCHNCAIEIWVLNIENNRFIIIIIILWGFHISVYFLWSLLGVAFSRQILHTINRRLESENIFLLFDLQVKNFGRSGRTKYTHLVDQDTTHFESPWIADTAQNLKFHTNKGGGMRQSFERPTVKRKWKLDIVLCI